jgi:hypothetical protein
MGRAEKKDVVDSSIKFAKTVERGIAGKVFPAIDNYGSKVI